jgi:hypothetical protein
MGVSAQTLDGVIKWKYVRSLAVLDVKAQVRENEVSELHSRFWPLCSSGYSVTRTQAGSYGFLTTARKIRFV